MFPESGAVKGTVSVLIRGSFLYQKEEPAWRDAVCEHELQCA